MSTRPQRPFPALLIALTLIVPESLRSSVLAHAGRLRLADARYAAIVAEYLEVVYHVSIGDLGQTDPLCPDPARPCADGSAWRNRTELEWTAEAVDLVARALGGPSRFRAALGGPVRVARWPLPGLRAFSPPGRLSAVGDMVLTDYNFDHGKAYAIYLIAHEFGHVLDTRSGGRLSRGLAEALEARRCLPHVPLDDCVFDVASAVEPAPGDPEQPYAGASREEYWAEAFATYTYPRYYAQDPANHLLGPRARWFVAGQFQRLP
jgi:hypothetical protein